MKLINDIISLLLPNENSPFMLNYEQEDNNKYELSYLFNDYQIPNFYDIHLLFIELKNKTEETKDTIHIHFNLINKENPINTREKFWIINSNERPEYIEQHISEFIKFIEQLSNLREKANYEFEIKFMITKPPQSHNNIRRIYSFDVFKKNLLNYSLEDFVINFPKNNFIFNEESGNNYIVFLIDETYKEFYTHNIFFIHDANNINRILSLIDNNNFSTCETLDFYNNNFFFRNNGISIVPYFYKLVEKSEFDEINSLFDNIVQYISLIFLSENVLLLDKNTLSSSIKGYTLLQIEKNLPIDDLSNTSLFEIFEWIYCGDKKEVRFEIATNIISLEYRDNINNINETVLNSIESNYIIYSIDNVERYIDIKSNIISSISDLGSTYSDSINNLISKLKSTLGLNITFFLSIIIFNLIENTDSDFFNLDIAIVSILIILGSFIFLLISIKTSMIDLYKYHNNVINIKNSYNNLIAENDIQRTIENFYTEETFKQAQKEISYYSKLGIYSLVFILLGVSILTPYIRNYFLNINLYLKVISISGTILLITLLNYFIKECIIYKYKYYKNKKIIYDFNIIKF